jgi:hypothetical protein
MNRQWHTGLFLTVIDRGPIMVGWAGSWEIGKTDGTGLATSTRAGGEARNWRGATPRLRKSWPMGTQMPHTRGSGRLKRPHGHFYYQ